MASQSQTATTPRTKDGFVAYSPHQWPGMVVESLKIPEKEAQKNKKLWNFGIKEHSFSSGSDLTNQDYLRLRVLWHTWPDPSTFANYMRDNPALLSDNQKSTPYTGYIKPENEGIANAIYIAIRPGMRVNLNDIQRVARGDAARPSSDCGIFWMARYWQGLLSAKLKDSYDEDERKRLFRGMSARVRQECPRFQAHHRHRRHQKQKQPRQPQKGFGTPAVRVAGPSPGGLQNPATADDTYVNTALLLLLQTVTRLMTDLEERHRVKRSNPSSTSTSSANSRSGSRTSS